MSILPQAVEIRAYDSSDQSAIDQLMEACWPHDPDTIDYYVIGESSALTLCAWNHEQLMGVGSLWNNRIHPQHCYIGMHVHPAYQRTGIEPMLYAQLITQEPIIKGRPLQTAIWSNAHANLDFLIAQGFQVIKQTYLGELAIAALELPLLPQPLPTQPEFTVYSFEQYSNNNQIEPLLKLASTCYQATHTYNPADHTLAEWQVPFLIDLHKTTSFVICDQAQVIGFNWMYQASSDVLEQGLVGVDSSYRRYQAWIIRLLFQQTLKTAHRSQYQTLRYEIDSIDPWAMELVTFLPIQQEPSWLTLCSPQTSH